MSVIQFEKTSFADSKPLIERYLNEIHSAADDFWEEHILSAALYQIKDGERVMGLFALHEKIRLTLFWLLPAYWGQAEQVFRRILDEFGVTEAFVGTFDELFLSLCLDCHKEIHMQAIFFDGTTPHPVRPPEFPRNCVQKILPEELPAVKADTGDFFDFATEENLRNGSVLLYRLEQEGAALGYGVIVPGKLFRRYGACGMITLESHRQKGVGRSIQLHLGDICREKGLVPISGCWYYNHLSRKTIESAGRYTSTRLLRVLF